MFYKPKEHIPSLSVNIGKVAVQLTACQEIVVNHKLETLADVYAYLFELDRKKEIDFDIEIIKGAESERKSALVFDVNNADFNINIFNMLQRLKNNKEAVETYWMDYQAFDAWEKSSIETASEDFLSEIEREAVDQTTLLERRNELEKKKLEELLAKKQADNNTDTE